MRGKAAEIKTEEKKRGREIGDGRKEEKRQQIKGREKKRRNGKETVNWKREG